MASRTPSRMLKRKLAALARLAPDDRLAVLDELDPDQRRRAEKLLQEHWSTDTRARHGPAACPTLSAWLVARIEGAVIAITPATQEALARAAGWASTLASDPPPMTARPGILERGLAALASRQRGR